MQGSGRTLLANVIMVIGIHVVSGDGYPRLYEYVGSFSLIFALLNDVNHIMACEGCMHTKYVRGL